jgi:hypothetical protein
VAASPGGRARREQHERGQVQARGQLVKVARTARLDGEQVFKPGHGDLVDRGANAASRGVEHAGQRRPVGGDAVQQPGQVRSASAVAGGYGHGGSRGGQFRSQRRRSRRGRA